MDKEQEKEIVKFFTENSNFNGAMIVQRLRYQHKLLQDSIEEILKSFDYVVVHDGRETWVSKKPVKNPLKRIYLVIFIKLGLSDASMERVRTDWEIKQMDRS